MTSPQNDHVTRVGWQGRRRSRAQAPRYRWQSATGAQATSRLVRRQRRRRLQVGSLLLVGGVLLSLLLYWTLFLPLETPYVAVVAPPLEFPNRVHGWGVEDLDRIRQLDGKTLRVTGDADAWRTRERGLADFQRRLAALDGQRWRTGAVVIHVSMPGAVDRDGRACLVPPDASPFDTATWLPLAEFLARLKQQPHLEGVHKLVVLDCSRHLADWNRGQLYNGFTEALADAVAEANVDELVVLSSCSGGEQSWTAPELQGTVFGHFLRLGIAGAADLAAEQGNADGVVALRELHRYVARHVDRWTLHHRDAHQRPRLVPESADFAVAWSLSPGELEATLAESRLIEPAEATVSPAEIRKLWQLHDELASYEPLRHAPLAWCRFEQELLWLEEASWAGPAYATAARQLGGDLLEWAEAARRRARAAAGSPALAAHVNVFADETLDLPDSVQPHSLAMAELLGKVDAATAQALRLAYDDAIAAPGDEAALRSAIEAWASADGMPAAVEAHLLRLAEKYRLGRHWQSRPLVLAAALRASAAAERVAAALSDEGEAVDPRARQWVLPAIQAADGQRRAALDLLLAGESAADGDPLKAWSRAEAGYDAAQRELDRFVDAFRRRDLSLACTPALARWLLRPQPLSHDAADANAKIRQALLPLIDATHALGGALAHVPAPDSPAMMSATTLDYHGQAEALFADLVAAVHARADELLATPSRTAAELREIEAVLTVPLLPWDQRERLWNRRDEIAALLDNSYDDAKVPSPRAAATLASADDHASDYLERVSALGDEHPALKLLLPLERRLGVLFEEPTESDANQTASEIQPEHQTASTTATRSLLAIAVDGQKLRDVLLELPLRVQSQALTEADDAAGTSDIGSLDRLARAACGFGLPALPESPLAEGLRRDLQQLLLWQARRTIDDALGPAAAGERPFFEQAASDYLAGAEAIRAPAPAETHELHELTGLLELRRSGMRRGLDTTATDILVVDVLDDPTVELAVQAGEASAGLPPGRPFVMLRDAAHRISGTSRLVDLAELRGADARQQFSVALDAAELAGRGPTLSAVSVFRGNEFAAELLLKSPAGVQVAFDRYVYGPPQVTVFGRAKKRPAIAFILDCSNSMSARMRLETPGGSAAPQVSRLEVAKASLQSMLDRLAAVEGARVGVRLLGHRLGRNRLKPSEVLRQNRYAKASEAPADLEPYADVEAILRLGRFDTASAESVGAVMKTVLPWGETPLYLAIVQAFREMQGDEVDTEQSIVVITDGGNDQLNAPRDLAPDANEVLRVRGDRPVRLFIVGFGLDSPNDEADVQEFTRLASATGGQYFPVRRGQELIEFIEDLLEPSQFQVAGPDGKVVVAQTGEAALLPALRMPERFEVRYDTARETVRLKGGEAVRLEVDRSFTRLLSVPASKSAPRFGPLAGEPAAESGRDHANRAVVERPLLSDGDLRLNVWLERDDGCFTSWPDELWVEIAPHAADSSGDASPYIFYDANFKPGEPGPLLECVARDWPAGAQQADVSVWCKYAMTKPLLQTPLDDVADRAPPSQRGFSLGDTGISYRVRRHLPLSDTEPLRVGVVEWHVPGGSDLGALKVELLPPADRVVHRFDAENGVVVHTFYYNPASGVVPSELRFTRREDLHGGALRLAAPITVDVFSQQDTVELSFPVSRSVRTPGRP